MTYTSEKIASAYGLALEKVAILPLPTAAAPAGKAVGAMGRKIEGLLLKKNPLVNQAAETVSRSVPSAVARQGSGAMLGTGRPVAGGSFGSALPVR